MSDPKARALAAGCNCSACPLNGQSPVHSTGLTTSVLAIVGENPGRTEEETGVPFTGASGYMLDKMLKLNGARREDFFLTNATLCRPDRKLKPKEWTKAIECCKPRLNKEIEGKKVLALGDKALEAVSAKRGIKKWFGYPIDSRTIANFHPAFVLRSPQYGRLFANVLGRALKFAENKLKPFKWPELVTDHTDMDKMVHSLEQLIADALPIAIDIENVGEPMNARIRVIGVGNTKRCVSVLVEDVLLDPRILAALRGVLRSSLPKVLHNAEHDLLGLKYNDYVVNGEIHDTLLMHAICEPQLPHGLAFVAEQYFAIPHWKALFKAGSEEDDKGDAFWETVAADRLLAYNAKDVAATALLYDKLKQILTTVHHGAALSEEQHMMARLAAMPMREHGVLVNPEVRAAHRERLVKEMAGVAEQFALLVPKDEEGKPRAELGATGQSRSLNRLFFEHYKLSPLFYTDEGKPKLDEATLTAITEGRLGGSLEARKLADVIVAYRTPGKLLSTYVDGLPLHNDGRVHPQWKTYGTVTGRWSSSVPNMQNLPEDMRDMFVVPEGWYVVGADYAALELRIAALLASDDDLIADFMLNRDTHKQTASYCFKLPGEWKPQYAPFRDASKTIAYGFNYNDSEDVTAVWKAISALFKSKNLPPPTMMQVKGFRKAWFELHPKILQWQRDTILAAQELQYSEAPLSGRRRYFYDGKIDRNVVLNNPVQATGADITNAAMVSLAQEIDWRREHVLAQIHDAIYLAGPDPKRLCSLLSKHMIQTRELNGRALKFDIELCVGKDMRNLVKFDADRAKFEKQVKKCETFSSEQLWSLWEHVFTAR